MSLNAMDNFPDQISLSEIALEALGKYLEYMKNSKGGEGYYANKKEPGAMLN